MNRCTWTETITFEKFINEPHYDEIKNEQRQIQCKSLTEEKFDEYGRAYCKEHIIKVDEINKSRHKNCIDKDKIKNYIVERQKYAYEYVTDSNENYWRGVNSELFNIEYYIKKGEFD